MLLLQMLRPSGFPEYTPSQQKIYDQTLVIIAQSFASYNYDHIWTPAVEKTQILTKGGGAIQNQIFGLHGLKQGAEDIKDYALHFDLTLPFARYVLDHLQDITFPFKRYQIQPVRRGERAQKGRAKEFRQCDIDSIWKSDTDIGVWYDIETISVLQKTLKALLDHFGIHTTFVTRISHIGLTKKRLQHIGIADLDGICALLDDYHKLDAQIFAQKLAGLIDDTQHKQIMQLLQSQDFSVCAGLEGYDDLVYILDTLQKLDLPVVYDFSVVRGLGYYTGTVFETFLADGGGSICSGGAYSHFTDFIDPKLSLSGVGGSIGITRMMDYLIENIQSQTPEDTYLIVNFEETQDVLPLIQDQMIQAGKIVELYPCAHKLKKQLEYADRKGIRYAVLHGASEQTNNILIVKDLQTGTQTQCTIEQSAGVVPLYRDSDGNLQVLILCMQKGKYWSFPKGHVETGEGLLDTARRELEEEVGITGVQINESIQLSEYNLVHQGQRTFFKEITYFVTRCEKPYIGSLQDAEIRDAMRCTLDQAELMLTYETSKKVLRQIKALDTQGLLQDGKKG